METVAEHHPLFLLVEVIEPVIMDIFVIEMINIILQELKLDV